MNGDLQHKLQGFREKKINTCINDNKIREINKTMRMKDKDINAEQFESLHKLSQL